MDVADLIGKKVVLTYKFTPDDIDRNVTVIPQDITVVEDPIPDEPTIEEGQVAEARIYVESETLGPRTEMYKYSNGAEAWRRTETSMYYGWKWMIERARRLGDGKVKVIIHSTDTKVYE